jgi:hypothetical protein
MRRTRIVWNWQWGASYILSHFLSSLSLIFYGIVFLLVILGKYYFLVDFFLLNIFSIVFNYRQYSALTTLESPEEDFFFKLYHAKALPLSYTDLIVLWGGPGMYSFKNFPGEFDEMTRISVLGKSFKRFVFVGFCVVTENSLYFHSILDHIPDPRLRLHSL